MHEYQVLDIEKTSVYNVSIVIYFIDCTYIFLIWRFGMTLREASRYFHIDIETLYLYEQNGLLKGKKGKEGEGDYSLSELQRSVQLGSFLKMGMTMDTLQYYVGLTESKVNTFKEQIRLLRSCRYQLLEEIHDKQKALDQLDYLIHEIKCRNEKGG